MKRLLPLLASGEIYAMPFARSMSMGRSRASSLQRPPVKRAARTKARKSSGHASIRRTDSSTVRNRVAGKSPFLHGLTLRHARSEEHSSSSHALFKMALNTVRIRFVVFLLARLSSGVLGGSQSTAPFLPFLRRGVAASPSRHCFSSLVVKDSTSRWANQGRMWVLITAYDSATDLRWPRNQSRKYSAFWV